MKKKIISILLGIAMTLSLVTGCAASEAETEGTVTSGTETAGEAVDGGAPDAEELLNDCQSTMETLLALVEYKDSDEYTEYTGEAYTEIKLNGESAEIIGDGASQENGTISITAGGTYVLSGTLTDGSIVIHTEETQKVRLVLNGAEISCSTGPAIAETQADKVIISLAAGTQNVLSDGGTDAASANTEAAASAESTTDTEDTEDTMSAALYCRDSLTINGTGSLTVTGNIRDGITSRDDLKIMEGRVTVTAADDGIVGKDLLIVRDGVIRVISGGDGLKSSKTEDEEKGIVFIEGGTLEITAGEGSTAAVDETNSAKAIKAVTAVCITGGTITLDSQDDAIHSNGFVGITGGTITAASGDDGVHADGELYLAGAGLEITKSYEGLEGTNIILESGTAKVTASDDGLNAAGGNDGSSIDGRAGQNEFSGESDAQICIAGGSYSVNASGDGVDSNGSITMTGGTLLVNGPTNSGNGILDYDSSFTMTGGTLLGIGTSGMLQTISSTSTQSVINYSAASAILAGTKVTLLESDGTTVLAELTAEKESMAVIISIPELEEGTEYLLRIGDAQTSVTAESGSDATGMEGGMGGPGKGGGMRGDSQNQSEEKPERQNKAKQEE